MQQKKSLVDALLAKLVKRVSVHRHGPDNNKATFLRFLRDNDDKTTCAVNNRMTIVNRIQNTRRTSAHGFHELEPVSHEHELHSGSCRLILCHYASPQVAMDLCSNHLGTGNLLGLPTITNQRGH